MNTGQTNTKWDREKQRGETSGAVVPLAAPNILLIVIVTCIFFLLMPVISHAGYAQLHQPLNDTSTTNTFQLINLTVNDDENDKVNVSIYIDNSSSPSTLIKRFEEIEPGSNLTYNWSYPVIDQNENSLVALWRLDENATDYTQNTHDGTVTGATLNRTAGILGGAYEFDGNDYIQISNNAALNPIELTITAWVKTTSSGSVEQIVGKDDSDSSNRVWQFRKDSDNKLQFILFQGSSDTIIKSQSTINDGEWHFVVGTASLTQVELYVDGVKENASSFSGLEQGDTNDIFIGRDETTSGPNYFNGVIDEVSIWNKPLSSAEIWNFYHLKANNYKMKIEVDDGASTQTNITQFQITNTLNTQIHSPENKTITPQKNIFINMTLNDFGNNDHVETSIFTGDSTDSLHLTAYYEAINPNNISIEYNYTSPIVNQSDPTLIGFWRLDKNGTDYSGNKNHATIDQPLLNKSGGRFAGGYEFNKSTGLFIQNTNGLNPTEITLAAWINTIESSSSTQQIVGKDASLTQRVWQFRVSNGNLEFIPFNDDGDATIVTGTSNINDGEWHFVVATANTSTAVVYVDGVLESSESFTGLEQGDTNNVWIGRDDTTSGPNYFNGTIDEVAIWNRSLSPDEITDLYQLKNQTHILRIETKDGSTTNTTTLQLLIGSAPSVTLESPNNAASQDAPIDFNFTATQGTNPINQCTLFHNGSGTFESQQLSTSVTSEVKANITQSPTSGTYIWNIQCVDNSGYTSFASANRTLTITGAVDVDGDGIDDSIDRLIGTTASIQKTGLSGIKLNISGSDPSGTFSGSQTITINDSGKAVVNFTHDFTQSVLDLRKITIIQQGSSIVINTSGQLNHTKTLWVDDTGLVSLCAKDAAIASLSEISGSCTEANEYDFTSCIGSSNPVISGPLTCVDEGSRIRIENLSHSGVRGTSGSRFTGATITKGDVGSLTETTAGNETSQGGNLTIINFSSSASTIKWQGYYGQTEASLSIGVDSNQLFDFGDAPNDQIRAVLATTGTDFNFANVQAANATDVDTVWGFNELDADSGNNTLDDGSGVIASVTGVPYANLNAYTPSGTPTNYQSGVLKDDGTIAQGAFEELAFASNVIVDQTDFANNTVVDFELIVPVNSTAVTQTYYFYVDIS